MNPKKSSSPKIVTVKKPVAAGRKTAAARKSAAGRTRKAVGRSVLSLNDQQAALNAARLKELDLITINVMASPGAGKTSVITALLKPLAKKFSVGVIEGDVASSIDTDRIIALGYPAVQINTDGGCHLSATMVAEAVEELGLRGPGYLFVENIGNLICPACFNLGERTRLVIASVPEGDDKPHKYPGIFMKASVVVLNKVDMLKAFDFSLKNFMAGIRAVNETVPVFKVSARTGQGVAPLVKWLLKNAR